MQRITRVIFDQSESDKISLLKEYNSLLVLLKNNLTERTFSILGQPKLIENNQYIGWYSNLEGQPILLNDIEHEEHKKQIEKTLNTRINDLELVTKSMSLTSEEQALISAWLPRIKNPGNTIYVINDDPVIVNSFKDPILPNPTAIPPASKSFWRWWYCLLLALFLIVLLGLIWFFFCPYGKEKVSDTPSIIAQNTEKNRIESTPIVEQPNVLEPKTEPVAEVKNCITTEEATDNKSASKMVMIFDNSASMTLTLMESQESIDKYLKSNFYSMTEKEAEAYETKMTRLPNRLSSSKEVALTSIDKIQQNIDISLVTLTSCPAAQTTSFYPYKDREKLKSKIKGLQPLENNSATPLYSGVKQASKMLDGINRDDYILIISDGEDNCTKSDICALANEISTTQPRLKINIVDIAGQHKIDCVAKSTGGNVYIAQNPTELINQMSNAVSDMNISKPICK